MGGIKYDHDTNEVLVWDTVGGIWVSLENNDEPVFSVEDLVGIFEKNPDLYNNVMLEMRNRKIKKILGK